MAQKLRKTAHKADHNVVIPNTPVRFLLYASRRHLKWVVIATVAVVIAAAFSRLLALIFKYITDAVENGDYTAVLWLALLYPALDFILSILWRSSGFAGMTWVTRAIKDSHVNLVSYTNRHSHSYFSDRFAGSLLSKINNITNALETVIQDFLWTYLATAVGLITSLILIMRVDVLAGLLFFAEVIALFLLNWKFASRKRVLSRYGAETLTTLRGYIVDTFTNIAAVRQQAHNEHEKRTLNRLSEVRRQAHRNSWFYSESIMIANSLVLFLFAVAILYILVTRWSVGDISAGDLVLVLVIFTTFTDRLIFIGRAFNSTAAAYGELEEGLTELLLSHEIIDVENAVPLRPTQGEIAFENVAFSYGEKGNQRVFSRLNITILPGQRVGLVGPSGAGKTTVVSLLLRQHNLDSGEIRIDDQNIAEVTQDSLRKAIAVVPQEPLLFHRTIKENIAYGKLGATKTEIEKAAKMAEAHGFIQRLSDGYNTLVGERGVKLSGGQRQRIAIARAMLKNAPILMLDEATSALDSESEVSIQKALHELMEGKTVIAIAHRLSTLREMDRIIVLEKGKIVEDGSHDELVAKGGTYARLWSHQAGGFLQE